MRIQALKKCTAIAFIIASAAAITTPAHAIYDPPHVCNVDIVCESRYWDGLDSDWKCEQRYNYCKQINDCWHHGPTKWAAEQYRANVIEPSYRACKRRHRGGEQ